MSMPPFNIHTRICVLIQRKIENVLEMILDRSIRIASLTQVIANKLLSNEKGKLNNIS